MTAAYDSAIANTLEQIAELLRRMAAGDAGHEALPTTLRINSPACRQCCATARIRTSAPRFTPMDRDWASQGRMQLQGKELSYNNLVDLEACWELAQRVRRDRWWRSSSTPTRAARPRAATILGGLHEGAGVRSGIGVWLRDRDQSRGGWGVRQKRLRSCLWRPSPRRRLRRRRWRTVCGEEEPAAGGDTLARRRGRW